MKQRIVCVRLIAYRSHALTLLANFGVTMPTAPPNFILEKSGFGRGAGVREKSWFKSSTCEAAFLKKKIKLLHKL